MIQNNETPPTRIDAQDALKAIVNLSAGWDKNGSLGPKNPYSWESVARLAMDYARAALTDQQFEECNALPLGWRCTSVVKGHIEPCAAVRVPGDVELLQRNAGSLLTGQPREPKPVHSAITDVCAHKTIRVVWLSRAKGQVLKLF